MINYFCLIYRIEDFSNGKYLTVVDDDKLCDECFKYEYKKNNNYVKKKDFNNDVIYFILNVCLNMKFAIIVEYHKK